MPFLSPCRFVPFVLTGAAAAQCGFEWAEASVWGVGGASVDEVLPLPGDRVVIGGSFALSTPFALSNVALLHRASGTWDSLAGGCDGQVHALARLANGDVVAGGAFQTAGGVPASGIARWDGVAWHPFGAGATGGVGVPLGVLALRAMPNGDLVAAGNFTHIDGVPASGIARWDGASWTSLGDSGISTPSAIAVADDGDLLAAGSSAVARLDAGIWTTFGLVNGGIDALEVLSNSEIVIAGSFSVVNTFPCENIARWNGGWQRVGYGLNWRTTALATLPNGDLLAGGGFTTAINIVGNGTVGVPASRIARFDGLNWSSIGPGANDYVLAIARHDDDTYTFGGRFVTIGTVISNRVATMRSSCPASATAFGAGCASSAGGIVALAPTSLPWLGTTFRGQATGVPANSLALVVHGVLPAALLLPSVVPGAGAGCYLLTSADVLSVEIPSAVGVTTQLVIPANPALIGQTVRQQVLPVEPMAGGLAISASNSLILVLGAF